MEQRLLHTIRTGLLSDASVERFKSRLARALRKPKADHGRIAKLEAQVANYADTIGKGFRSVALPNGYRLPRLSWSGCGWRLGLWTQRPC